ncbi:MAG: hypothetical protein ABIG44_15135 [Planctomycetota bacterium]
MDNRYRFVIVLATLLSTLLIIFLCGLMRDTRNEVRALREVLASKQDLVNIATPRMALFHEDKCTSCHTERRFAGPHNMRGEIEQAVAHMSTMPDTRFTDEDLASIHGSLKLLRCAQCHGVDRLRTLAIKSPEERMRIIRRMISKPNSNISPDEANAILRVYEETTGF